MLALSQTGCVKLSRLPVSAYSYVGQRKSCNIKRIQRDWGLIPQRWRQEVMCVHTCVCVCVHVCVAGPEPQSRAGYPPVAVKPAQVSVAPGGAGAAEGGAQSSPAVLKKTMPVQSSRPQAATPAAQNGEATPETGFAALAERLDI